MANRGIIYYIQYLKLVYSIVLKVSSLYSTLSACCTAFNSHTHRESSVCSDTRSRLSARLDNSPVIHNLFLCRFS